MLAVAVLGSLMISTGVVAIFIPVVLRITDRPGSTRPAPHANGLRRPVQRHADPDRHVADLVINYELMRTAVEGLGFFSITPIGLPILVVTILYMLVARRWLRSTPSDAGGRPQPEMMDWIDRYDLANREYRVRVLPGVLPGEATAGRDRSDQKIGIRVLLIERSTGSSRRILARSPETILEVDDILLLDV